MTSSRSVLLRAVSLVASLIGLFACSPSVTATPSEPVPVIDVPRFAEAPFYLPVGQSLTLTATLKHEDGSALTTYDEFRWNGLWSADGSQMKVEVGHPSPGVETVTLTPRVPGRFGVNAFVQAGIKSAHTRYAPIISWGGTTKSLLPFQQAMSLVVGEERPTAVYPAAQANDVGVSFRVLGNAPVAFSVDDPTVASVTSAGVVTALAAGATRLRFKTGTIETSIPLTVTPGVLAPPADGIATFDGLSLSVMRSQDGAFLTPETHTVEGHVGVASNGYPLAVVESQTHFPAPVVGYSAQGTVLMGSWTGSGLGVEWVSEPWDDTRGTTFAVDQTDAPYAVWHSLITRDLIVATRPAKASPERWTRRHLPMDLDIARQAGLAPEQYVTLANPIHSPEVDRAAILPRQGGGVWVAWRIVADFTNQDPSVFNVPNLETPGSCADVIRLAEVTADGVTTQDVRVQWSHPGASPAFCRSNIPEETPLHLLPPAPGERLPRIISTWNERLELFESRVGAWTTAELGHKALQLNGFYGPTFVTVARPDDALGPVVLLSYDERTAEPLPAGVSWNRLPGKTPLPYLAYGSDDSSRLSRYFGFVAQGRLYSGSAYAGPWVMQSSYDGFFREEPSGAFVPGPYDKAWGDFIPLFGEAHRGQRLHLLSASSVGGATLLTRAIPQADPLPTDAETTGTRLSAAASTPMVSSSPVVMPDGSRYLLTDAAGGEPGALLRSAGPGQPFVTQLTRAPTNAFLDAKRIWASGPKLYFFRSTIVGLELHASADQGRSFSKVNALTPQLPLQAGVVHPQGQVYAMRMDPLSSRNFKLAFAANPSAPFQVSDGFTGADATAFIVLGAALFPISSGALLVLEVILTDGTVRTRFVVQKYGLTGTVVSQRVVDALLSQGHMLHTSGCGVSKDDAVLLCVNQTEARRIDLATGAVTGASLPSKDVQESVPAPLQLPDGRFLLPLVNADTPHAYRAGYRLSTDGLSYGPFVALRPQGGDGQAVLSAAVEASTNGAANVLFVLSDSGQMMAGDGSPDRQSIVLRAAIQ